jgi:5-methylcytosine-specific restriction endonuclease McrA
MVDPMSPLMKACARCPELVPVGTRHCPACALAYGRKDSQRRNKRTTRDGRNTTAWLNQTRPTVLDRDGHQCQHCGAPANTVHRVEHGHHTTDPNDYVTLCARCHGKQDGDTRSSSTYVA